jgi:hypothetical protein
MSPFSRFPSERLGWFLFYRSSRVRAGKIASRRVDFHMNAETRFPPPVEAMSKQIR